MALILSSPRTPAAASGAEFGSSPHQSMSCSRHTRWSAVAKRTVRTTLIIFEAPASRITRFVQIAEEFAVEAFIAQLVMKALKVGVLPRASGLDVKRLNLLDLQPVLHAGGDKLGPVVAQLLGHSIADYGRFDYRDDIDGSDRPPVEE